MCVYIIVGFNHIHTEIYSKLNLKEKKNDLL